MAVITYSRQSFGAEQDSTSIAVQQEECRKWAMEHGMEVAGEYQDAQTSSELYPLCDEGLEACRIDKGFQRWLKEQRTQGRKQYKEGLGQAFQRIAEGGITHLLIYTRNRLGRTADGSYLDRFLTNFFFEHKVSLVCVQDGTVQDFSDDFISLVMSIKDTLDYKGLKEKRLASMASVDKRINSYRKYSTGWGVIMQGKTVTFDADKAEAIRYAFEKVVAGATYPSILKVLNTTYRHLWGGKQCYQSSLSNLLHNPVYCGYMRNREGILDRATNIPAPIISYSLWHEAQEIMEHKRTNAGKYHYRGQKTRWLPLSGYLRCDCGRKMLTRVDRGKPYYECPSPDHTRRIYVDNDVLKTIQKIFIIGLLDDSKRLAELSKASDRVDTLKAQLERLQGSLRAKMALVETEEDIAIYKPILDGIKKQIADTKQALIDAQGLETTDTQAMQDRLERDFSAIMEGELLSEETYQRLLQSTIDFITVENEQITVKCRCGVSFSVPRIEGKHHSRRLMQCTLLCDSADENVSSIRHYQLHWYDGDEAVITGGECVYEDENLSVFIH